jgi:SHS2 domain-containing protein
MKEFEFLEHTADLKFRAYGRSLEECLANSVKAIAHAFIGEQKIPAGIVKTVSSEADSLEVLVHDFLSELIYFFATEQYVAVEAKKLSVSGRKRYALKAEVLGGVLDFSKHRIETEVKAVTYHDMVVQKEKDGWIIQLVCDI